MVQDAQGLDISGGNQEAAAFIDDAIRAFTLNYGDVSAVLTQAEKAAPPCVMVQLIKAWLLALSNDPAQLSAARQLVAGIRGSRMNEREASHLAALGLAAESRWPSAVTALDRHLMSYPHDLMAHQAAMRLDGYLGRFHRMAGRAARALPFWSEAQSGYGIMLSFYGFGLEESGDYAKAEDISRTAAELEPYGYWPHHAISHVLEMTGRPKEGLSWMNDREQFWSGPQNTNKVHIWWHKSLFHVELDQRDEALAIYDDGILASIRPVGASLCNLTALLWRLETLGCAGGTRWDHQCTLWQERADGCTSPFNDIHSAMAALGAGNFKIVQDLMTAMRKTAAAGGELAPAYGLVAIPVVEAMTGFARGIYQDTIDRLLPVRAELWRMGGSTAQRDLIEWTLTEAAVRAGAKNIALSLANERLAERPGSAINQDFLKQAQALG